MPNDTAPNAHADDPQKSAAAAWFSDLQNQLIAAFERLEDLGGPAYDAMEPGRFEKTPWKRGEGKRGEGKRDIDGGEPAADEGGGVMAMMRGRVFEKVGVHFSQVFGAFSEEFRGQIPGAADDPRFWACGVSLIAHSRNPHAPAAHMNTRMIATTKRWFGGGGDLNPMLPAYRSQDHEDAKAFHKVYEETCDRHNPNYYTTYKNWCDDYFYLPHRNEPRGVGGIFYDRLDTGNWDADFAFTQDVGRAFLEAYFPLVELRMATPWSDDDRDKQLFQRGRYAEYNLLYDRGTTFGLKTGGNVESILSSLPPLATWA
ncbi:MAG: oxygen-dependent coproporphyrinogen oxidase [Pseudomonadota bacterium]